MYSGHMGRIQAYLPDDLHAEMKRRGLSASKLLQDALHRELRRAELTQTLDEYLADMDARLGPATDKERADAEAWVDRVVSAPRPGKTAKTKRASECRSRSTP